MFSDAPLWRCPYTAVPGFPAPTVAGHSGILELRRIGRAWVLVFGGRFHLYEGYQVDEVVAPVVLASLLGIRWLVVTNAAGSVTHTYAPGDVLLLRDALNLSFRSLPMAGRCHISRHLFPHPEWRLRLRQRLEQLGVCCPEATYAAMLGPTYETPAEVRFLQRVGAEVVGMSTVHELQCAVALGIGALAFSVVTNWAAGLQSRPLSHAEVMETVGRAAPRLYRVVKAAFSVLPDL